MSHDECYSAKNLIIWAKNQLCECNEGYPDNLRTYYKTSGNETRESLAAEQQWHYNHMYCSMHEHGFHALIEAVTQEEES